MIVKLKDYANLLLLTGIFAYFAGGFVLGFVIADCSGTYLTVKIFENIVFRPLIGIVYTVLSAVCFGFPPRAFGGEEALHPFNAWPYIFGCWLVFFIIACLRKHHREHQKGRFWFGKDDAPEGQ